MKAYPTHYFLVYHKRGYGVLNGDTDKVVFSSLSKSECIAESQRLNGYEPIDGDEGTYGQQTEQALRRSKQ
jgi:hypothetical protein